MLSTKALYNLHFLIDIIPHAKPKYRDELVEKTYIAG